MNVARNAGPTPSPSPGTLIDQQFVQGSETETGQNGVKYVEGVAVNVYVFAPTPPPLKILDCVTNQFIDGQNTTKIDGQLVDVRVQTANDPTTCRSAASPLPSPVWSIPPNQSVANSNLYGDHSFVAPTSAIEGRQEAKFYWTAPTSSTPAPISVVANVAGQQESAQSKFTITAPTVENLTAVATPAPLVSNMYRPDEGETQQGWTLSYGQDLRHSILDASAGTGVAWTYKVQMPGATGGYIGMLQLVAYSLTGVKNGATVTVGSTPNGTFKNDGGCVSLTTPVFGNPLSIATWSGSDAPVDWLNPSYSSETQNQKFTDYFLYKPTGGIWVALGTYHWSYGGTATYDPALQTWKGSALSATFDPQPISSYSLPTYSAPAVGDSSICPANPAGS